MVVGLHHYCCCWSSPPGILLTPNRLASHRTVAGLFGLTSFPRRTTLFFNRKSFFRISSMAEKAPENVTMKEHCELLEAFYKIPGIDKAWLFPTKAGDTLEAMIIKSEANFVANSKRKYQSFVQIPKEISSETSCNWSTFPVQLAGVSLLVPSKSGEKLLVVKNPEGGQKNGPSATKFEIWSSAQLVNEILIPPSIHGSVYADGWFEGVSWSHDESFIAYIAEEGPSNVPIYGSVPESSNLKTNEKELYTWKGQGDWQEDWGEAYTGKPKPCLFVADLKGGRVQKVNGIPDDLSVGQVIWAPGPSKSQTQLLVFVGWPFGSKNFGTQRKLGIKYCYNRPCALYAVEAFQNTESPAVPQELTNSIRSAFLPRFSPNGDYLIFLSADEAVKTGVHNGTNSLHKIKWPISRDLGVDSTVHEVVSVAQLKGDFPGLYCESLIALPWLSDNETIVLSSAWFSTEVILSINISSGKVSMVSPSNDNSSWSVLSVHDNYILAATSNFGKPHSLKLGVPSKLTDSNSKTWTWFDICNPSLQIPSKVNAILSSIVYEIIDIPVVNSNADREQHYEAIFISSKADQSRHGDTKRPLVVVVHGGPHSVYSTSFSKAIAFLVGVGLNLLLVNYRGSLGFGEETLQSLPGKAGQQDVEDVLRALDIAVSRGLADPKKVAVTGGSHGGFLSTHLIGQAPDRFVTAAVRNPVCNISSMIGTSDIPDWCYVETFGQDCFNAYKDAPTPQDLEKFYQASPIRYIDKVKVPTLFLLGAQDRRVPISNGFQYVHALRARGQKVKVIVFPEDAHPIDRPQSEFESWVSISTWLIEHFQLKDSDK